MSGTKRQVQMPCPLSSIGSDFTTLKRGGVGSRREIDFVGLIDISTGEHV